MPAQAVFMERSRHRSGLFLGCAISACAVGGSAWAGDWTVKTNLSETLSVNDNLGSVSDPEGYAFGSNSNIGLDVLARSYVYDFNLKGNLGYQTYFGDGADSASESFRPSLSTSYVRRSKDTTFSTNAAYVFTPASNSDGLEVDSNDSAADRQTISAGYSVAHKINARNDATVSARASRSDFLGNRGDEETNSQSLGSTLSWLHRATKRTDFTLSTGVDWYGYDDAENTQNYLYFMRAAVSARLSPRLTVNASAGPQLREDYVDGRHKSDIGGLGDVGFSYALKTSSLSGSASYGLSPNSDGNLRSSLGLRLNYSYRINGHSQFGLGSQLRFSDDGEGGTLSNTTFSISPTYSYTLARDWQLSASYQFAASHDSDGPAIQNSAFLTLSRSYVLLP